MARQLACAQHVAIMQTLMRKHHRYVPVILTYETKTVKWSVNEQMLLASLLQCVRSKFEVSSSHALFLLTKGGNTINMSDTMKDVHARYKSDDGVLYMTCMVENVFGG